MSDSLSILKKELDGSPRSLYIFHGDERYLLEYYLGELRKKLVSPGMEDFNLFELDGGKLDVQLLAETVDAVPMFSERKLVVVTDLNIYSPGAERKEALEAILSDLPEYTTLVFVYDTVAFKPDARVKMHKLLTQNALVVNFELQNDRELITWLRRRFAALNKTIGFEEAQRMLFVCGKSMTLLVNEVEKVAAYSASENISVSDIEAVCVPSVEAVMYHLADAVSARKFVRAIELERALVSDESPTHVLAVFSKQMRDLLYARIAIEARKSDSWLSDVANIRNSYAARKTLELARKFSTAWCREAVTLCAECDYDLKRAPGDRDAMLEMLILRLAALKI